MMLNYKNKLHSVLLKIIILFNYNYFIHACKVLGVKYNSTVVSICLLSNIC